ARQALVPQGATVLPNEHGTAPGLYLPPQPWREGLSAHLFLLPGPPRELQPMVEGRVLAILRTLLPAGKANAVQRIFRIAGLGESQVEERVGNDLLALPDLELGYCARPGEVDVRLIGALESVERGAELIERRLARFIAARDDESLPSTVARLLAEQNLTLATAESCTGGEIASSLVNVPGVSRVFVSGAVPYANSAKIDMGVSADTIDRCGAVSEEVAIALAEAALARSGAGVALTTTGIAGPDGGSEEKPVGTVFLAVKHRDREPRVEKRFLPLDRVSFKRMATHYALDLLRRELGPRVGPWNDRVVILQGSLATLHADALAIGVNADLTPCGAEAEAVFRAAGPLLGEEVARLRVSDKAEILVTKAHRLVARRLLHVLSPAAAQAPDDEEENALLRRWESVFAKARECQMRTLAVPLSLWGGWEERIQKGTRLVLEAARAELACFSTIEEIRLVCATAEMVEACRSELGALVREESGVVLD
ncbi:MAG: nicotinamide-nucleotide amidohydrolase family protein, partial [Verrucomicrobiia bacterium]